MLRQTALKTSELADLILCDTLVRRLPLILDTPAARILGVANRA
jgi:hypothetical protein